MPVFKSASKWVHPLCALWIPELFQVPSTIPDKQPCISINNLDKKRFSLKCNLCHQKGACVQCCSKRCTTGAHPWCVVHNPQGFTKRIVNSPENVLLWEIFCKPHASAVSEPVKPRPRAKQSLPLEDTSTSKRIDDFFPVVVNMPASHNTTATTAAAAAAAAAAKKDDADWRPIKYRSRYSDTADVTTVGPKSALSMDHMKNFNASSSDVWDNANVHNRRHKQTNERYSALAPISSQGSSSSITDHQHQQQQHSSRSAAFPILSMAEWPGQSEGEAMDMEHFWRLVSEYYPEDHPREWLDYRMTDILQGMLPPTAGPSSKHVPAMGGEAVVIDVSSTARRDVKPSSAPLVKPSSAPLVNDDDDDEHRWRIIPGLGSAKNRPEVGSYAALHEHREIDHPIPHCCAVLLIVTHSLTVPTITTAAAAIVWCGVVCTYSRSPI